MKIKQALSLCALLLMSTNVAFASGIRLVPVTGAGSACPAGPIDAELVDDETIELHMDPLVAASGQRANCTFFIGFRGAAHLQIAIDSIDVEYSSQLRRNTIASFDVSYYVQGGLTDAEFSPLSITSADPSGEASVRQIAQTVWTPCGAGRSLVTGISLTVPNTASFRQSEATVLPLRIKLKKRSC